jgi:serine/threonine protein kinase
MPSRRRGSLVGFYDREYPRLEIRSAGPGAAAATTLFKSEFVTGAVAKCMYATCTFSGTGLTDDPFLSDRLSISAISHYCISYEVCRATSICRIHSLLHHVQTSLCSGGLAFARRGMIHRDIKPANVLLTKKKRWSRRPRRF